MSLLDRLSNQVPKRKKDGADSPIYKLTLRYVEEIDRAKEKGYSWWQIKRAFEEEVRDELPEDWRSSILESCYRKIKKESRA